MKQRKADNQPGGKLDGITYAEWLSEVRKIEKGPVHDDTATVKSSAVHAGREVGWAETIAVKSVPRKQQNQTAGGEEILFWKRRKKPRSRTSNSKHRIISRGNKLPVSVKVRRRRKKVEGHR